MVTLGTTLILSWRGTVTVRDVLADKDIKSSPYLDLAGFEVQQAQYDLVKDNFKFHQRDIVNTTNGEFKSNGKKVLDSLVLSRRFI